MTRPLLHTVILLSIVFCAVTTLVYAEDDKNSTLEDSTAGMQLGMKVGQLTAKYPDIYRHQLFMGEILFEACNQRQLEVFTFTEMPWSKGYITEIWVHKAEESVCRDSSGSLPDYSIKAVTKRGVKLGNQEADIIRLYGKPTSSRSIQDGSKILTYKEKNQRQEVLVTNLVLHFKIYRGLVSSFSLSGDMPWAKKPF